MGSVSSPESKSVAEGSFVLGGRKCEKPRFDPLFSGRSEVREGGGLDVSIEVEASGERAPRRTPCLFWEGGCESTIWIYRGRALHGDCLVPSA